MGCLKSPSLAGCHNGSLEVDTPGKDMGSKLSLLEAWPAFHEDLPAEDKGHGMARGSRQVESTQHPFGSEVHLRAFKVGDGMKTWRLK